jgi:hypothetical protein
MTEQDRPEPAVGDIVGTGMPDKYPGRWSVKIGPTKKGKHGVCVLLHAEEQQSNRDLWLPVYLLEPAPAPSGDMSVGRPYVEKKFYDAGMIVKTKIPQLPGLYVVINDPGHDNVSIAPAGGAGGRYRRVPRAVLTEITLNDLTRELLLRAESAAQKSGVLTAEAEAALARVRALLGEIELGRDTA